MHLACCLLLCFVRPSCNIVTKKALDRSYASLSHVSPSLQYCHKENIRRSSMTHRASRMLSFVVFRVCVRVQQRRNGALVGPVGPFGEYFRSTLQRAVRIRMFRIRLGGEDEVVRAVARWRRPAQSSQAVCPFVPLEQSSLSCVPQLLRRWRKM